MYTLSWKIIPRLTMVGPFERLNGPAVKLGFSSFETKFYFYKSINRAISQKICPAFVNADISPGICT